VLDEEVDQPSFYQPSLRAPCGFWSVRKLSGTVYSEARERRDVRSTRRAATPRPRSNLAPARSDLLNDASRSRFSVAKRVVLAAHGRRAEIDARSFGSIAALKAREKSSQYRPSAIVSARRSKLDVLAVTTAPTTGTRSPQLGRLRSLVLRRTVVSDVRSI
jgi:hypothetical protein